MELISVKILEGYKITIPKAIREKVGIEKGDWLTVSVEGNMIIFRNEPKRSGARKGA